MGENQAEIDALLAEVNALASEAVDEIGSDLSAQETGEPPLAAPSRMGVARGRAPAAVRQDNLRRVLHLEVPVIVRLAERCMPMSEILKLSSGAIIEFEKPADGELDLLINNKCIGHGQAVKVSENFGLRITQVGSVQDRIRALGS